MSQKRCQNQFTSSATLLVLSGLHLQSIQQCLARLQGPEITLKVLPPAPKRFALLPSKLLCPPRGGWEAEESLSGMGGTPALSCPFQQKPEKGQECILLNYSSCLRMTRQKPMTSVMQMLRLQEVPGYPGLACSLTKTLDVYTKNSLPTIGTTLPIPLLTPESTAPFSLSCSGSLIFHD